MREHGHPASDDCRCEFEDDWESMSTLERAFQMRDWEMVRYLQDGIIPEAAPVQGGKK